LLDTNHASPLVTLEHPLRARILAAGASGDLFCIATPCIAEAVFGFGLLPRAEANRRNWSLLRPQLIIYTVAADDAELAADLRIELRRQGWQLDLVDALVAAIALRRELTVLTTDQDFERVPNLRTENWLRVS